uniref:Uncharacterized protein n=1 Tax=Romanomermis culicivorax TaxID=13658 RepID=A0A915J286_ROMCU
MFYPRDERNAIQRKSGYPLLSQVVLLQINNLGRSAVGHTFPSEQQGVESPKPIGSTYGFLHVQRYDVQKIVIFDVTVLTSGRNRKLSAFFLPVNCSIPNVADSHIAHVLETCRREKWGDKSCVRLIRPFGIGKCIRGLNPIWPAKRDYPIWQDLLWKCFQIEK